MTKANSTNPMEGALVPLAGLGPKDPPQAGHSVAETVTVFDPRLLIRAF